MDRRMKSTETDKCRYCSFYALFKTVTKKEYIPVIGKCEDECNVVDTGVTEDSRLPGGGETRA